MLQLVDELSSGNTPKWPVPLAFPIKVGVTGCFSNIEWCCLRFLGRWYVESSAATYIASRLVLKCRSHFCPVYAAVVELFSYVPYVLHLTLQSGTEKPGDVKNADAVTSQSSGKGSKSWSKGEFIFG